MIKGVSSVPVSFALLRRAVPVVRREPAPAERVLRVPDVRRLLVDLRVVPARLVPMVLRALVRLVVVREPDLDLDVLLREGAARRDDVLLRVDEPRRVDVPRRAVVSARERCPDFEPADTSLLKRLGSP